MFTTVIPLIFIFLSRLNIIKISNKGGKIMSKRPKITMDDLRNYPRIELTEEQKKSKLAKFFNRPLGEINPKSLEVLNGDPCNPQLAMPIENRSDLLLPGDQSVEIGYCAMKDGTGFVANKTFFPNSTPEMFDWWFNFHALEGIRLAMWLPNAHIDSFVKDPYLHCDESGISLATRNWNKEHYPSEGLMNLQESGVCCIRFYAPQEFGLDMHKLLVSPVKAHACGSVLFFGDSLVMFGEQMAKELREKDPDIKVPFNTIFHAIRPVEGGCEMRSRFWIGKGMQNGIPYNVPMPENADMEAVSWVMLRHTLQEMSNLASLLPEVYNMYEGKISLSDLK